MAYPSGGWDPPSDSNSGDNGGLDLSALGAFSPNGQLLRLTPEQRERSLSQLSKPLSEFPQPPFWFREKQKHAIALTLAQAAGAAGRPLTTDEADALAYHRSRESSVLAWRTPVWHGSTLYFTWRGLRTFRFPFYTPKPASFNPHHFPNASRPILSGRPAMLLWQFLRINAYSFIIFGVTTPIFVSVASSTYLVGVAQDPRLQDIRRALLERQRQEVAKLHGAGAATRTNATPSSTDSDRLEQQRQQPQPPRWSQGTSEQWQRRPQAESLEDDSSIFDDASPVAPSERRSPQPSGISSNQPTNKGGSSWDRLRQRSRSSEDAWDQEGQAQGESRGQRSDQYTYSQADEEKAYAKEKAQKEFDAMLERERQGVGESGRRF